MDYELSSYDFKAFIFRISENHPEFEGFTEKNLSNISGATIKILREAGILNKNTLVKADYNERILKEIVGNGDSWFLEALLLNESERQEIIGQLRTELTAVQAKADDLLDKLQRTAAEFQNSRRRQEKQLADEIDRASTHLIQRLLPSIDDLDLAFQNVPAEVEQNGGPWLEGLRQIQKKLTQLLEERGVTAIAKEGAFDPMRHEAVSSEPSETVESGQIIQTLRTGYEYKGRVLRPALVRVAA